MKQIIFFILIVFTTRVTIAQGTWQKVSAGEWYSVAVHSSGSLWSWGVNNLGQLGIGTSSFVAASGEAYRSTPGLVHTIYHDWVDVACSQNYTIGLRANGTIWGWGYVYSDSLGEMQYVVPTQIGTDTNWVSITAGYLFYGALKSDGTLWTWGRNTVGQLGLGFTNFMVHTPTQVGTQNNWNKIDFGGAHAIALDSAGHLFFWGVHTFMINDVFLVPTQMGMSTYKNITAGQSNAAAIKSDGSLWVWGVNIIGQLGLGDSINRFHFTQLGTENNWERIFAGPNCFVGIKQDETVWGWGLNQDGLFGIGSTDFIPQPTLLYSPPQTFAEIALSNCMASVYGTQLFGFHMLAIPANRLSICSSGTNEWGGLGNGNQGWFADEIDLNCYIFTLAQTHDDKLNDVTIVPNPSDGLFQLSTLSSDPILVIVIDQQGKQVATFELNELSTEHSFDLSGQEPGVYFASIIQGKKQCIKKLLLL
jgi:alpha-tubulin suppressor-like RCC1 family protein